jgi:hypothetical protein
MVGAEGEKEDETCDGGSVPTPTIATAAAVASSRRQ